MAGWHQNGILKPGGMPMPDTMPDILSFWLASTRRTASFTAAASRSSRISLSSDSKEGSISTFLTSCRPFMVTFTSPAPDSPVTSALAISSWAFCICSCICWAFFIRSPMLFIIYSSPGCFCGADTFFDDQPFKSFHNTLDQRILPNGLFCRFLACRPLALLERGRCMQPRHTLLYLQLCGVAEARTQGRQYLFFVTSVEQPRMAFVQSQNNYLPFHSHGRITGQVTGHAGNTQRTEIAFPDKPIGGNRLLGLGR